MSAVSSGSYTLMLQQLIIIRAAMCAFCISLPLSYKSCQGLPLYSNIYPTRCNVTQFVSSGNCSTCFGWYHHPSSGAQTTVSTASGICQTAIAICRYRGRVRTALSVLWVVYTIHSTCACMWMHACACVCACACICLFPSIHIYIVDWLLNIVTNDFFTWVLNPMLH
jgi:hypothetical protein